MFDSPFFNYRTLAVGISDYSRINKYEWLLTSAHQLFIRALQQGWFKKAKAVFLGRPNQPVDLNHTTLNISGRHALGRHTVMLSQIRATFGRARDLDVQFYPCSERPRERHHRLSVAKALNQMETEAEVTQWELASPLQFEEARVGLKQWVQTKLLPQWRLS